jgi:glycine/D-amino acid oxidase-like deaminating enzyme
MHKVDYIIVGCGLAGVAFCEQLRKNNKTFIVYDDGSQQSSLVAAGMYNPVILKRFSEVWMAEEQLNLAKPFYKKLENLLNVKLDYEFKLFRRFTSIEEQNMWFTAMDKPKLEPFLSSNLIKNANSLINAPFGFGEVQHAGRVDTNALIKNYSTFLDKNAQLQKVRFDYNKLEIQEDNDIKYESIQANKIVFCEGFGITKNPFFNLLPLKATKGEVLTIEAPNLNMDFALKSSVFVIPEGNNLYSVGATYNWENLTNYISENAKFELIDKLKNVITCDFKVVNQVAGVRPTVKDRRPLVGSHQDHNNMFVLNGLGTRGVMIAPYIADQLYNFIEDEMTLNPEIDITRFPS